VSLPPAVEAAAADLRGAIGAPKTWRIWGVDFDARIVQTITACMLILMVAYNNKFVQMEYDHFALEAVIPLAIIILFWRESPRRYGFVLGNWRLGLAVAGGFIVIMAVVIWVLGHTPDFRAYYTLLTGGRSAWRLIIDTGIDMFAWEFFFRGWLLWSLGRKYGTDAIWLQMIPFALMHVWKPELELLSTIAGGVFFGILAWRTRSFIWGWLLHWFMVSWILLVAGGYV
jgi:membrane protease YdiL (CAAX protease family)